MRTARLLLLSGLLLAGVPGSGQVADPLLADLDRQLRAGELEEALRTARRATSAHPGLTALWYNLAGLEAQVGDPGRAETAFERAVTLGFDDFRYADRDADLAPLTARPFYARLRAAWADGLARRRTERALALTAGAWSPPIPLPDRTGGVAPPTADLRLRADATGLQVEMMLGDPRLPPAPPWHADGGGVLLSVVLAEQPDTGEGRQSVDFGFGWLDGLPAGAVRVQTRWQRLVELTPKFRLDHDTQRLRVSFRIPWDACGALHPLVDDDLGLNVVYRRGGRERPGAAALLADPGLGRADRPWRRSVPLTVRWRATEPAVVARLDDHVVRAADASLRVRALLPPGDEPADVHLVVRDGEGTMVHDSHAPLRASGPVHAADVAVTMPDGAGTAWIGVSLGRGGSRGLDAWETKAAVIPDGWLDRAAARIDAAPARERPSLRYRLDTIAATLAARRTRDDATALAGALDDLDRLLARLDDTGTSLPDAGPFLAVVPGTGSLPPLPVSLALPPGWRDAPADLRAIAVLARAPGAEGRAVRLAPRLLEERAEGRPPPPVLLAVPHLPPQHDPEAARQLVDRVVSWLRGFLGVARVHLAGVDLLAATILETAARQPDDLAGLLMITGVNFTPYPDADRAALAKRVADIPDDLPLGWLWFPDELGPDDQAADLRRALQARGHDLAPARPVAGGLSFEQAWQRALLWAAGW